MFPSDTPPATVFGLAVSVVAFLVIVVTLVRAARRGGRMSREAAYPRSAQILTLVCMGVTVGAFAVAMVAFGLRAT